MISKIQFFITVFSDRIYCSFLNLRWWKMIYLVISDLHVPTRQSEIPGIFLEILDEVDGVIALGDFVNLDTVLFFQQSTRNFFAVHGNMDEYDVKNYLPDRKLVLISGLTVGLCHGWGSPYGIRRRIVELFKEKPQLILYGHTHVPDETSENGILFLNPGSAMKGGSYGLLKIENTEVNFEVKKIEY